MAIAPFDFVDGWPIPPTGSRVVGVEAGILGGELMLEEETWQELSSLQILSLRTDEHDPIEEWRTVQPDGSMQTSSILTIPTEPVPVPVDALAGAHFGAWLASTHGLLGELLLWDSTLDWWLFNDPDFELTLIAAPPGMFDKEFVAHAQVPGFHWLPVCNMSHLHLADVDLRIQRYGLNKRR